MQCNVLVAILSLNSIYHTICYTFALLYFTFQAMTLNYIIIKWIENIIFEVFESCICHKFEIGFIFEVLNEWIIIKYKNLENIGEKLHSIDPFFKLAESKINIYSRYGHSKYFAFLRHWIRFRYALFWI